jgi:DNA damage-binding protein 1
MTVANGNVEDTIGRPAECGHIGIVDPKVSMIGLHMYDGYFKIIPIDADGKLSEQAFNVRLDELKVIDVAFLDNGALAVLHEDTKSQRHVRTYNINNGTLENGPWSQANVDGSMLVPFDSGCLIVGQEVVSHFPSGTSFGFGKTIMKAFTYIGNAAILLADNTGGLHVLTYEPSDGVGLQTLQGVRTSTASCLEYLDSGIVFVGSSLGDSQLIKVDGEGVSVVDQMINLGPIVDFVCLNDELVLCAGGCVRSVRSGVGVELHGTADLQGARRLWGIGDRLVVGIGEAETMVLGMVDGEIAELEDCHEKILSTERSILVLEIESAIVQVTQAKVTIDGRSIYECPSGSQILSASAAADQNMVCLGLSNKMVMVLDTSNNGDIILEFSADNEVSSVDIFLDHNRNQEDRSHLGITIAVATWEGSVTIWNHNDMSTISFSDEEMPRDVRIKQFGQNVYLFVGTGQGAVISFRLTPDGYLEDRKKVSVGREPVILRDYQDKVTAISDKIAIISFTAQKLVFSSVNIGDRVFDAAYWKDFVVLAMACGEIRFATLNDSTSLHVTKVDLDGLLPRRIAMKGSSQSNSSVSTFLTSASIFAPEKNGDRILLLDENLQCLDQFEVSEIVCSICVHNDKYFVGSAVVSAGAAEPSKGHIRKFAVINSKLVLESIIETKGAVYSMASSTVGLVAGIGGSVVVYCEETAETGDSILVPLASYSGFSVCLDVQVNDDGTLILVGDLMRSVSVLSFDSEKSVIQLVSRDFGPRWISTCLLLDGGERVVLADSSFNMCVLERQSDSRTPDEEKVRMSNVGEVYLGSFVNRFRVGCLSTLGNSDTNLETVIFGSIDGSIRLMAPLRMEQFQLLSKLQTALNDVVGGVGGLGHREFRQPNNPIIGNSNAGIGLIDGDLCEMLLELSDGDRKTVLSVFDENAVAESVVSLVESLSRLK